jgi:hypothetical protein
MSRRRDRATPHAGTADASPPESGTSQARSPRSAPAAPSSRLAPQLAILTAVFAITVLIAELAGAANLGVSLGIGQVAFAIVLVVLFSRR